jgi:hypothetical protein
MARTIANQSERRAASSRKAELAGGIGNVQVVPESDDFSRRLRRLVAWDQGERRPVVHDGIAFEAGMVEDGVDQNMVEGASKLPDCRGTARATPTSGANIR